jgi:flagellar biosynthetic protein FliQ
VVNEADALDIVQAALWTVIAASGPAILAAMVVGVVIALFQALTQVQEMTLTFVPKIVVVLLAMVLMGPFVGAQVLTFSQLVYSRIEKGF